MGHLKENENQPLDWAAWRSSVTGQHHFLWSGGKVEAGVVCAAFCINLNWGNLSKQKPNMKENQIRVNDYGESFNLIKAEYYSYNHHFLLQRVEDKIQMMTLYLLIETYKVAN